MSAIHKEKIYIELRKYHLDEFPGRMATQNMGKRLMEFRLLEDTVINMLLGLVSGKSSFVDYSEELKNFKKKVAVVTAGDRAEDSNRNMFRSKIIRLIEIIKIANTFDFPLKTRKGFH